MAEKEQEVETFQIDMMCENIRLEMPCPGRMLPTGRIADNVVPKLYEHRCTKCDEIRAYTCRYPFIKYKPKIWLVT
jgi:hypothetical protein